ncbi:hypothetical protein Tco_1491798 [Tanacetum coccineum]
MRIEESLNVRFNESPPPKSSPLVDDDILESEIIENQEKDLEIKKNEPLNKEIVNIKETKDHPIDLVIEPKNIKEAIQYKSWTMAMQEELNQFKTNNVWSLVPPPDNQTVIEGIDLDETYAPVARLESIRILLAYACAHDFKLFQMLIPSCFAIFHLEPLTLSLDLVLMYEIFKSLSFRLDCLCRLAILCLDQHAHTLHHLESLLTISLDRLDILKEDLIYQSSCGMNSTPAGMRHHHLHLYMNPKIKQLAKKRVDEYGFIIRPDLVRLTSGSVDVAMRGLVFLEVRVNCGALICVVLLAIRYMPG